MTTEREDSKKQILRGQMIDSLRFDYNDQNTHNSVKATQDFLKKAFSVGKRYGFTNIRVRPGSREADMNNPESYFIDVIGDRLETDEEVKKRMNSEYIRQRERRKLNQKEYDYFNSDVGRAAFAELEKFK